jgi:hypothetical protein
LRSFTYQMVLLTEQFTFPVILMLSRQSGIAELNCGIPGHAFMAIPHLWSERLPPLWYAESSPLGSHARTMGTPLFFHPSSCTLFLLYILNRTFRYRFVLVTSWHLFASERANYTMKQFDKKPASKGKENSRQAPACSTGSSQELSDQLNDRPYAAGWLSDFDPRKCI